MINGAQELTVRALVDTGAPKCIVGRAVADALYIDFDEVDLVLGRHDDDWRPPPG